MVINMGIINPRERLSAEDYLYLFWFEKIIRGAEIEYDEFQPTESMINHFNAYVKKWTEDFYHDPVHFEKPVDWDVERKKTPYFKEKLKAGHKFEVWAEQEFKKQGVQLGNFYDKNGQYSGENAFGLEIKHDMKLEETGNSRDNITAFPLKYLYRISGKIKEYPSMDKQRDPERR